MIFRALDQDNDWMFGKGKQSYFTESQAIAANIKTGILSYFGDCFFDQYAGINWPRLLGGKKTATEIKLTVRAVILKSYGVLKINRLDVVENRLTRSLSITYDIDTIYTENLSQTVGV